MALVEGEERLEISDLGARLGRVILQVVVVGEEQTGYRVSAVVVLAAVSASLSQVVPLRRRLVVCREILVVKMTARTHISPVILLTLTSFFNYN